MVLEVGELIFPRSFEGMAMEDMDSSLTHSFFFLILPGDSPLERNFLLSLPSFCRTQGSSFEVQVF